MKKLYFLLLTLLITSVSFGQATDLYISMFGEGSGDNKFIEIYNGTANSVDLSLYSISTCSNGCDVAGEFDYPDNVTFASGTMIAPGDVYVIAHGNADAAIVSDQAFTYLSNGDDAMALTLAGATATTYTIVDLLGDLSDVDGDGWDVAGVTNATYNHTFTRKASICSPNPNALGSFGTDAATSEWIVTDQNSEWANVGSHTGCVSDPVFSITAPSDGQVLTAGTTSVDITVDVANFVVGNPGAGIDGHIHWTIDSGSGPVSQPMKYNTDAETITVSDGGTYTVYMELVDNSHTPIVPAVNATTTFSVAYPCDLQIGTVTETCDAVTSGTTDTYNVTIDFTGGATSTYVIDTEGHGTLSGDHPSFDASGTITITGIPENTDFTLTVTGDPMNSGCDLTESINSPDCDPALVLPLFEDFDYTDGSLINAPNWENFSGTSGDLQVTSGQALVQHGTPSEDASISFTGVTGDIFYAFDFIVVDPGSPISGTDFEYFAMFRSSTGSFIAKLDVVAPNAGGDFTVGIGTADSTADAVWATDLSYDTTYRATVRYNQDSDIAELWIDATSSSDTSILGDDDPDPGSEITEFALRQSDSSLNEGILVDNLSITQTFNETLSIENQISVAEFSMYPNPTSTGFVTITSSNNEAIQAQVFDVLGKQVISNTISNNKLDVSSLNTGIYIVKLTQNNAIITKKLVIK